MRWYIVQVFHNSEKEVINYINKYIFLNKINNYFGNIILTKENITNFITYYNEENKENFLPGYIYIEMIINNYTLNFINKIPNVLGFLGRDKLNNPIPLNKNDILPIINNLNIINNKNKFFNFNKGDKVKIKEGPFTNFIGLINKINYKKNILYINVIMFNRKVSIKINFNKVKKI